MITKSKGGFSVKSESTGKNLGGPYPTEAEAVTRLRQVEYFKHHPHAAHERTGQKRQVFKPSTAK